MYSGSFKQNVLVKFDLARWPMDPIIIVRLPSAFCARGESSLGSLSVPRFANWERCQLGVFGNRTETSGYSTSCKARTVLSANICM